MFNKNYQILRVNKQRRTLFLLLQNFLPFNLDLLSWQIDCIIMCTLFHKRRRGCLMFTFQHVSTLWKKKRKICSNLFSLLHVHNTAPPRNINLHNLAHGINSSSDIRLFWGNSLQSGTDTFLSVWVASDMELLHCHRFHPAFRFYMSLSIKILDGVIFHPNPRKILN